MPRANHSARSWRLHRSKRRSPGIAGGIVADPPLLCPIPGHGLGGARGRVAFAGGFLPPGRPTVVVIGLILVAWLSITLTALLGVALMRAGLAYARRLRRETAKLLAERSTLNHHLPDPDRSVFFASGTHPEAAPAPVAKPRKRHWFRRGHHAV